MTPRSSSGSRATGPSKPPCSRASSRPSPVPCRRSGWCRSPGPPSGCRSAPACSRSVQPVVTMPEIDVDSLVKRFGEQRALDEVTFHVGEGELFTLLGPSGCGKSTTLMSVAGFQTPEHGTIAVGSETFFDASRRVSVAAERRNLGMVFQSYAVWPHMTVFENLAFPLKVRKTKRSAVRPRVVEVLELVEMSPYVDRYPHQLSGGQQQRVALARAL